METSLDGATVRHPGDDKEWLVSFDEGGYSSGFDGVPNVRVSHLTTGKTRIYSLLSGEVMLCTDRSAVLAAPTSDEIADQGQPEDCKHQNLAPEERAVFARIKITGRYQHYYGPSGGSVRTVPGWTETPVPPEWKWNPSGSTPGPSSPTPQATPGITPTPQLQPGGSNEQQQ